MLVKSSEQLAVDSSDGSAARVSSTVIVSRDPRTGNVVGQVPVATPLAIRTAMEAARLGQRAWEGIGLERRLVFMQALRDALYCNRDRMLAALVSEQGKVLEEAQFEYLAVIEVLDFYLRAGGDVLRPREVQARLLPHRQFIVERQPLGVVLVIAPWNYPLFLSLAPIAAALLAGNAVLYKPSEYAAQVGEVLTAIIAEAGIPAEVFQTLHGYGDVGAALIEARPDHVVFTGSVPTGKKIAKAAAEQMITTTLELGGKDAAIVLSDADIEYAARRIIWASMFNAGQTCAAVERVIVERPVAAALLDAMRREIEAHLLDADGRRLPALAPLTTPDQLENVAAQVQDALAKGAQAFTGGYRLEQAGKQFYAPTILTGVTPDMLICQEETFGPVLGVTIVEHDQAAVQANNATDFGLTASVWTRSQQRGMRVAEQLHVGHVSLNSHLVISGVAEVPWGGVKDSGYGRLHGVEGLLAMTRSRTVDFARLPLQLEPFTYPYNGFKRGLIRRGISLLYAPGWQEKLKGLLS
ncbi:MAG: aldehyde dehydrogenase family protein [Anaerolineae bacterium]|nr:aldehyde dehydrogenase family protein [Anaerolineae bacterium]